MKSAAWIYSNLLTALSEASLFLLNSPFNRAEHSVIQCPLSSKTEKSRSLFFHFLCEGGADVSDNCDGGLNSEDESDFVAPLLLFLKKKENGHAALIIMVNRQRNVYKH